MAQVSVEFCGEWTDVADNGSLTIGREADLIIDERNPFLHRRFLAISSIDGLWWLLNVGDRLSASITDNSGTMQAVLSPGARLPLVFDQTKVVFTAGPTTYEFSIHTTSPEFATIPRELDDDGPKTIGQVVLTDSQKLLILVLAEPMLMRDGESISSIPSSADAADRLGWTRTKFNRKLDNVCDKLDRMGVRGLRGGPGRLASNRRARLVEYAVMSRVVDQSDLPLLHKAVQEADEARRAAE
ncbi:hypothetical protein M3A96_05325 [Helcobacillus massiliensis]|uniref:FHA domain-containing protein n=1 Tax=Helcobacillus massiliensis TaxID=521392 RepID=A0A839QV74_9MICO|nr:MULTISPECIES: hypothetical protein [Helcobacillus]MBB3021911.1 hypothetical protein [Helcobacillus massiliensis]MCG7427462.1 hypothetical protein [Helcobacillus sp. ACRRO]MCT1557534.1 hypothetical protein [Helcobacillus massiliensis]MCT2037399.1 hypothetical protein [Helcobacillus massiliensis]MCT2331973.1 hypothetical protein [Helcobacillus massiliensis]